MGIIEKYPGVIAMSLAGHTHMDEFRLMSPGNALAVTAGISPFFGNNPAYKIFAIDGLSLAPFDYSAVNCNLSATPAAFSSYYTFSKAYEPRGPTRHVAVGAVSYPAGIECVRRCNTRAHSIPATTRSIPSPARTGQFTGAASDTWMNRSFSML